MKEHIIALDAMGGDNAPDAIVAGGIAALRAYPDIRLLLSGPEGRPWLRAIMRSCARTKREHTC